MQDPNPKTSSGAPFEIRVGVWLVVTSLLLACLILLVYLSDQSDRLKVKTERTLEDLPRPMLSGGAESVLRVASQDPKTGVEAPSIRTSAAISNELVVARQRLTELRTSYSEDHPDVHAQIRAVESLERSSQKPGESLELAKARADLAKMEVYFGPQHPDLEAQQAAVQSLEYSAQAGETAELAQAKAQLAKLRVHFGNHHPAVQSQVDKIGELQQ